jgi:CHAD domain-containing protein
MPFHFKINEPPVKAFRRICHDQIGAARRRLRKSSHGAAVHGVRKDIKKLRALLRLVREEISADTYHKAVKFLRQAADCLAATRDARVRLQAFKRLTRGSTKRFAGINAALRKHALRETRRFRDERSASLVEQALRKADRRIAHSKIQATGRAMMEVGLKKCHRRSWAGCQLAGRKPLPENFHKWRKHVKDLRYYYGLLHLNRTLAEHAMESGLKRLAERLGEHHDLVMLREFTRKHFRQTEVAAALNKLIDARQKELRVAALKLGARLFTGNAFQFSRRLENYRKKRHGKQ